jgi:hypothetical protein
MKVKTNIGSTLCYRFPNAICSAIRPHQSLGRRGIVLLMPVTWCDGVNKLRLVILGKMRNTPKMFKIKFSPKSKSLEWVTDRHRRNSVMV